MAEQRQPSPAQVPEAGAGGNSRIAPRNLTARPAARIAGNPDITRPEDAVANCYPGLELDVRNLDRRFFPGLVFEFVARNDTGAPYSHPMIYGARLSYVDVEQDPDLATARGAALAAALGDAQGALGEGDWYLDWIEQSGRRLGMDRKYEDQAGALNSFPGNRPYQYDHFQINKTWQDLNVVINDTEIGPLHAPRQIDDATPFTSPEELATELRENLAGLELALICEYL